MSDSTPKTTIVTGASQGIGAGLVQALLRRGDNVVANSRSIGPSENPRLVTVPGDIADPHTATAIVDAANAHFGRVDLLVNNAGIFIPKPFTAYTHSDFVQIVAVNLAGFFHLSQLVATRMIEQRAGHIVQLTTSLVDNPDQRVPSVLASMSKGGLQAATTSLSTELAVHGVRVNAVSPGATKTPMNPAAMHDALAALHPLGRMAEIDDIVAAILYLDSATFVTGEILHVDGGQAAGH